MKNRAYKDMVEAELRRHGVVRWRWAMRGKHEACYFLVPFKTTAVERFTIIPCTPGDHRGVLNKRSDIRKELAGYGLVPQKPMKKVRPETCGPGGIVKRAPHLDELDGDR